MNQRNSQIKWYLRCIGRSNTRCHHVRGNLRGYPRGWGEDTSQKSACHTVADSSLAKASLCTVRSFALWRPDAFRMTLNHVRKNSGPRRTQRDSDFSRLIAAIIDKRGRKREQKKKKTMVVPLHSRTLLMMYSMMCLLSLGDEEARKSGDDAVASVARPPREAASHLAFAKRRERYRSKERERRQIFDVPIFGRVVDTRRGRCFG